MSRITDLEAIAREFGQYRVEAYAFVGEGLHQTVRAQRQGSGHHLSAAELVEGVLDLAAQRYGLIGAEVLAGWGLRRSEDLGVVTYHLIEKGLFGKAPTDSIEDFAAGPVFTAAIEERVRQRIRASPVGETA